MLLYIFQSAILKFIIVMISIFIKILVYDSEMGEDFVNRFFGGELNKVVYYVIIIIIIIIITGSRLTYLSSMFLTRGEVSVRTTRSSQLLHIPLYKSKSGQRTFFYRAVSLWNSLDNSLKLCNSSRNFKHKPRAKLFTAQSLSKDAAQL